MNKAFRPNIQVFGILMVYISFVLARLASGHIIPSEYFNDEDEALGKELVDPEFSLQQENRNTNIDPDVKRDNVVLIPIQEGKLSNNHYIHFKGIRCNIDKFV